MQKENLSHKKVKDLQGCNGLASMFIISVINVSMHLKTTTALELIYHIHQHNKLQK
jgi:hypothetical protein